MRVMYFNLKSKSPVNFMPIKPLAAVPPTHPQRPMPSLLCDVTLCYLAICPTIKDGTLPLEYLYILKCDDSWPTPKRELAGSSLRWISPKRMLACSLYKCVALWRAVNGPPATERPLRTIRGDKGIHVAIYELLKAT